MAWITWKKMFGGCEKCGNNQYCGHLEDLHKQQHETTGIELRFRCPVLDKRDMSGPILVMDIDRGVNGSEDTFKLQMTFDPITALFSVKMSIHMQNVLAKREKKGLYGYALYHADSGSVEADTEGKALEHWDMIMADDIKSAKVEASPGPGGQDGEAVTSENGGDS